MFSNQKTSKLFFTPQNIAGTYRTTHSCKCRASCSCACGCSKIGSGCNQSCSCYAKCNNIFNGLDYFFGPNHQCTASPCFKSYFAKHGVNGFQTIDRDELRNRILMNGSFMNVHLDKKIIQWKEQWNVVNKSENVAGRLKYTQQIFRLLLSNESKLYYSFCDNEMHRKSCYWHCSICQKCDQWRSWHCGQCKKCQFGLVNACDTCGGKFIPDKIPKEI